MTDAPAALAVPQHTAANLRRSVLLSVPLGGVALLILALLGHPVAGLLAFVGLALGALNSLLVQRSVVRFASRGEAARKQQFIGGALSRLGAITAVALLIVLLVRPDGLGVLGGLAAFQLLMLANAALPLIKELRGA